MAKRGIGHIAGDLAFHAPGCLAGIIDGKGRGFIPAEKLVDHGVAFLAGIEKRESGSRAIKRAANCAPVRYAALVGFEHGKGELVVRGTEFFAHYADNAVKCAVAAGIALVPIAVVGNLLAFGGVELVRLPAELPIHLGKTATPGRFFRFRRVRATGHAANHSTHCQTTQTAEQVSSVKIHAILLDMGSPRYLIDCGITAYALKSARST